MCLSSSFLSWPSWFPFHLHYYRVVSLGFQENGGCSSCTWWVRSLVSRIALPCVPCSPSAACQALSATAVCQWLFADSRCVHGWSAATDFRHPLTTVAQYPIRLGIAVQPVGVPRRPNGSGIWREIGTVMVGYGNHSLERVPEAALQLLTRVSATMKQ